MGYCSKYHFNSLGSIMSLTDTSGNVVIRYVYDVYGKPEAYDSSGSKISNLSTYKNLYLFTGRRWDKGMQFYHYRARAYNPSSGRFLQRDPIRKLNLYEYAKSNPTFYTDPTGRDVETDIVKLIEKIDSAVGTVEFGVGVIEDWSEIKKAMQGDVASRDKMLSKYGQKGLEKGMDAILDKLGIGGTLASAYLIAFKAGVDIGSAIGTRMAEIIEKAIRKKECCDCKFADTTNFHHIRPKRTKTNPNETAYMVKPTFSGCTGLVACYKNKEGKYYVRRTKSYIKQAWIAIFGGTYYYWAPCDFKME